MAGSEKDSRCILFYLGKSTEYTSVAGATPAACASTDASTSPAAQQTSSPSLSMRVPLPCALLPPGDLYLGKVIA